jgi:F-type H+-transporting ATPase subunit a
MASEQTPVQTPQPASVEQAAPKPGFGERMAGFARRRPFLFWSIVVLLILLIASFVMPSVPPPHVALGGEPISINAPWWLTNSILTTIIVDIIILLLALFTVIRLSVVPNGLQNVMEAILEYIYGLAEQVAGKAARTYFPWVMTIFLLVILSNWSGLVPGVGSIGVVQTHGEEHLEEEHDEGTPEQEGTPEPHGWNRNAQLAMADGMLILLSPEASSTAAPLAAEEADVHFVPTFRAPSADLNMTFALSLTTMFMVQVWGVRALGGSYFKKFFNASGKGFMIGINIFVGILELISEFARIISFGFRLFGNIFAGEIVLATMAFLVMYVIPVPFYILEVFVGFVQALVFTMLALVFFSMATVGHHDEGHEHH